MLGRTVIIIIQMGGVQSQQRLGFIFDDYELIGQQGQLKLLEDKNTEDTFALRQECFVNRKQYDQCFKRLTSRNQNHDCENMLRLTKLWSKEHNGICSNMFKIYTVYEYPKVKLIDQIEARFKEKKYFEEIELFSILQSCINALSYEPRYANVSPHIVFIIPEGILKLVHVDLMDPNLRSIYNSNYYYSPEKIEQFQSQMLESEINLERESVFCLGMTILHSAILENPHFCYQVSNKRVNKRKLEVLLSQISNIYSSNLFEVLSLMLETNPSKRITFETLQQQINEYFGNQSVLLKSSVNASRSRLHDQKPEQPKQQISLKRISSENKSKEPSSLAYSGDTFFRAPSMSIKNETNFKNIKRSELEVMMELSNSENSNVPKNHYMLEKTKKSKIKNTEEKQNEYNMKSLVDTQKNHSYNASKNIACSKDLLSEYEFNSENKERCVFVIQTYEDNSRYEGMMQNSQKNGYGKLVYQDGVYYEGNFKNDCIHGKGTLYYGPDRPAYSGQWLHNKFNGKGTLYNEFPAPFHGTFDYSNFNKIDECWVKFEGNFINDIKQGSGKIYLTNGQTMQGIFSKGLLNGEGYFRTREGETVKGIWSNNVVSLVV